MSSLCKYDCQTKSITLCTPVSVDSFPIAPLPHCPKFPVRTPLKPQNRCSILPSRELGGTVWAGAVDHRTRVGNPSSTPGADIFRVAEPPPRESCWSTPPLETRERGNWKWEIERKLLPPFPDMTRKRNGETTISYFPCPISPLLQEDPRFDARPRRL